MELKLEFIHNNMSLSFDCVKIKIIYIYIYTHINICFEMWFWRRMEKISWTDHVRNEDVLLKSQ